MGAVSVTRVPARSEDGAVSGYLRIALLPRSIGSVPAPLIEASIDMVQGDVLAQVQLLEGHEYFYEWEELPAHLTSVFTGPEEVFQPDTADGVKGRLRPGLATGVLDVRLRSGNAEVGQLELEVRSRKLRYLSEYRWMLRDIADRMTELIMERFSVSGTTFAPTAKGDAATLYTRFAFLRSLLSSELFHSSLAEISRRPHVAWVDRHEAVHPGQAIRSSSYTIRQLSRPGVRATWPDGPIPSIPAKLDRRRREATHDTTPNRFVRFALERWRQVMADIDRGLSNVPNSPAVARGRREVATTIEQLDATLTQDLFKELGSLSRFPADDQVLQRREGYRDVFRAYLEFELAAQLSWRGAESSYSAGQRDVAMLYEYWAFIHVAQLVADLAGQSFDLKRLIEVRADGLNVVLQAGKETVLSGTVERLGRRMTIEFCFNKTFRAGAASVGSWTRAMRPDYSLIISAHHDEPAAFEPIVLHFDAKYRVNFKAELFGLGDEIIDDCGGLAGDELQREGALRADLLKMHAYRDAIRRSAGAYVIYPGDDDPSVREQFTEYQELLPGLGAFVLRPAQDGAASGVGTLRRFLNDVFEHVATRLTRHERGRYWLEEAYNQYEVGPSTPSPGPLSQPQPGVTVLLGYVKSRAHWRWIQQTKNYNVRTQGRSGGVAQSAELLYCQLLLLYCLDNGSIALARIISDPELMRCGAMASTGYPDPVSDYWCVQIHWIGNQQCVTMLTPELVDRFVRSKGRLFGEPMAVNWSELESGVSHVG
jgi:predicted component of viral defense system (DUF524 family)